MPPKYSLVTRAYWRSKPDVFPSSMRRSSMRRAMR